jgi:phosphopantothenate-cysteine ligase/phosphopantothenoylcysteine decarboxylase/phosphopantothenate--cysteine ligase
VSPFRTFDDLRNLMESQITRGVYEAIIHCAAVSDFQLAGVYAPAAGAAFDSQSSCWHGGGPLVDASAGKVKSQHPELWMRMIPTPKLVDQIRRPWGFGGVLVKFKREVDVTPRELAASAADSRRHSDADLIVANTLEGMHDWALLGRRQGEPLRIDRQGLPAVLLQEIETIQRNGAPHISSLVNSANSSVTPLAVAAS